MVFSRDIGCMFRIMSSAGSLVLHVFWYLTRWLLGHSLEIRMHVLYTHSLPEQSDYLLLVA
jgi:hypothetical protein